MSALGHLVDGGRKLHTGNPFTFLSEEIRLLLTAHYQAIPYAGPHEDALDIYLIPVFPEPMTAQVAMDKILIELKKIDSGLEVIGPKRQTHGAQLWRVYHGNRSIHFMFMPRLQDMDAVQRSSREYTMMQKTVRARRNVGMELRNHDIFAFVVQHGDSVDVMKELGLRYGVHYNSIRSIWVKMLGQWNRPRKQSKKPIVVLNPRAGRAAARYRVYGPETRYMESTFGDHRNDLDMPIQQAMKLAQHND